MGNRLSRIVTRTGDKGTTGLGDGQRVDKDNPHVQAMGDVDELNSHIGLLLCEEVMPAMRDALIKIQHALFDIGGELCIPGHVAITENDVLELEQWVTHYNADLPPLKDFILPGGTRAAAQAHVCRTVCRRAERTMVTLAKSQPLNDFSRQYMNRLSDLLFVLARALNKEAGRPDSLWEKERRNKEV